MSTNIGPVLTDKKFFGELLNTATPGLEAIPALAAAENYAECRRVFAAFFRAGLKPEVLFTTVNGGKAPEMTPELRDNAEKACRHYMVSCGTPADFAGGPVDWFSNPTFNKYCEWPWQLSRHAELQTLAKAYRATGDETYAEACAELFDSWVKQAAAPTPPCTGYQTLCWRTIECGIRMGLVWPEIIHTFYNSPAFSDDIITDWCKSVWEHGERMRRDYTVGNWLIHELNGLVHIGVLYPFFHASAEWYAFAMQKLQDELDIQVYPDGAQFEITTGYQWVVIRHYMAVLRLLKAYGIAVDPVFYNKVEELLLMLVRVMKPDGHTPDINDGGKDKVGVSAAQYGDVFPDDPVLRWVITDGKEGNPPEELSSVLPYAGLAALRTGWDEKDTWMFFDGGPFGAGHQHEDKLNVLFHADGVYSVVEGNKYAYDTSEMRQYVLDTRSHNTVRVDGMEQNRRKTYKWNKEDIARDSGMLRKLTPEVDALRAAYNEGYGEAQDKSITHERSVYFMKALPGCKPFGIVVDRLTADKEHDYEVLWHLDGGRLSADGLQLKIGTLHVLVPEAPMETAGLSISYGVQYPRWQGWVADSARQKDYHPVYTAQHWLHGQDLRWVTVLYPDGGEAAAVTGVSASLDVADTKITLQMADGSEVVLDEAELL